MRVSLPARQHRVAVYLRLPTAGTIGVTVGDDGVSRLILPPGSEADRVTRVPLGGPHPGFTVADVRGASLDEQGREHFHVYRPVHGGAHAPLVGYQWLRNDEAQRSRAHQLIVEHVRATPRAGASRPPSGHYLDRFTRLMHCEGCHQPNKAAELAPTSRLPLWPTDAQGWYVPLAVMRLRGELSTTAQFHDPNAGDPFVTARCGVHGERNAIERQAGAVRWYQCENGTVPYGVRAIRRAVAQHHVYSVAVCRSRRWLYARMDAAAKAAFANAIIGCEPIL